MIYKPTPISVLGLVARLWGRVVILDMDDLGSDVMKLEGQSKVAVWLVALSEGLALRYSSAVTVASTNLAEIVRAKHPGKKVLVLPNAVEPSDYAHVDEAIPRHGVYFFGALNRMDLIEDLLQAAPEIVKAVPDVAITIAGGGSSLNDAKELAGKLGMQKSVKFTGWLSDMTSVQAHTRFADVGVCYQRDTPTVRAASNMKVFQYMAMRTVPVVSDVGDLRHYVQDGKAGVVVKPGDPQALARAVIALLKDDKRRVLLANRAWKLAQTEYSWKARADQVAEFIMSIKERRHD
jgi:glycosyltransferase involved in cell wall biosynthesis